MIYGLILHTNSIAFVGGKCCSHYTLSEVFLLYSSIILFLFSTICEESWFYLRIDWKLQENGGCYVWYETKDIWFDAPNRELFQWQGFQWGHYWLYREGNNDKWTDFELFLYQHRSLSICSGHSYKGFMLEVYTRLDESSWLSRKFTKLILFPLYCQTLLSCTHILSIATNSGKWSITCWRRIFQYSSWGYYARTDEC